MKQLHMKAKDAFIFNLKHAMYVLDINQVELAERSGVSRQFINNVLKRDSGLAISTVEKIAKALGLEETDLFDPNFQERYKKKVK